MEHPLLFNVSLCSFTSFNLIVALPLSSSHAIIRKKAGGCRVAFEARRGAGATNCWRTARPKLFTCLALENDAGARFRAREEVAGNVRCRASGGSARIPSGTRRTSPGTLGYVARKMCRFYVSHVVN